MPAASPVPSGNFIFPPTRAEMTILPLPVADTFVTFEGEGDVYQDGTPNPTPTPNPDPSLADLGAVMGIGSRFSPGNVGLANAVKALSALDFLQTLRMDPARYAAGLTDYMSITLRDRAGTGQPLIFKFLINPNTIQMNRQVVDAETMTRSGMLMGIWGDTLDVTMSGQTAGQYFAGVLVDGSQAYSLSYLNLMQLVSVYENNGSWFEGEILQNGLTSVPTSPLTRHQIQMQADVQLVWQNHIWYGCFTDLSIDQDAEHPHVCKFSLSFMTWKERFKSSSPWRNSLENRGYFGHAYEIYPKNSGGVGISQLPVHALAVEAAKVSSPGTPDPSFLPGFMTNPLNVNFVPPFNPSPFS